MIDLVFIRRILGSRAIVAVATLLLAASFTSAEPASIIVDVARPGHHIPKALWGIFFEEINHAGDGGLYAELVQNRDFEANTLPQGWQIKGTNIFTPGWGYAGNVWFTNDLPGWSRLAEGGADVEIAQESAWPLNDRNPHSLRLTVKDVGQRAGVINSGFWGMNFQTDDWYDLSFYARTENNKHFELTVSLESQDGQKVCARATVAEVGGEWKKYTLPLNARLSDPKGRMVITMAEPGTIWFDVVSLFPRKTFKNRPNGMRTDLAQMLVDLHPGFLRFPGGCVVEGVTLQDRFRWKDSIGDISQRKGGFDLWSCYNSYGLGFHEYLQLCEDLDARPVFVINCGMSHSQTAATNQMGQYVQDAFDAIEYANGPTNSTWGWQRALNGHPAPFNLKYMEIGNEEPDWDYASRYVLFQKAINAVYPQMCLIRSSPYVHSPLQIPFHDSAGRSAGQSLEIVDLHRYDTPEWFFNFFNLNARNDSYGRSGMKIYFGEYAVNQKVGHGNLLGALAEAVFMLGLEKNSEVVKMASYAPLFENINQNIWGVNLILLDSSRTTGRSSYQVQKLFSANRPDYVLDTDVQAPQVSITNVQGPVHQLYALGGLDQQRQEVVIKVVNPTPTTVPAVIRLKGMANLAGRGKVITVGNAVATAENTLDHPDAVVPVEADMEVSGAQFTYSFNPNSLTILRMPAGKR